MCVAVGLSGAALAGEPAEAPVVTEDAPRRVVVVEMGGARAPIEGVRFDASSATTRSDGRWLLDEVAAVLADHPDIVIAIEGHAEAGERDPDTLARNRAEAVLDELVARGVAAERMKVTSYGAERPRAAEPGLNRRVEFRLLGPRESG